VAIGADKNTGLSIPEDIILFQKTYDRPNVTFELLNTSLPVTILWNIFKRSCVSSSC